MSDKDFARYWKVECGIKGNNGPLIELRYDRDDDHTRENLQRLQILIEELKELEIDEVLSSPELISQIWHIPRWMIGQQFRWERNGYSQELLNRLAAIRQGVDAELFRVFNSRFPPDWETMK